MDARVRESAGDRAHDDGLRVPLGAEGAADDHVLSAAGAGVDEPVAVEAGAADLRRAAGDTERALRAGRRGIGEPAGA